MMKSLLITVLFLGSVAAHAGRGQAKPSIVGSWVLAGYKCLSAEARDSRAIIFTPKFMYDHNLRTSEEVVVINKYGSMHSFDSDGLESSVLNYEISNSNIITLSRKVQPYEDRQSLFGYLMRRNETSNRAQITSLTSSQLVLVMGSVSADEDITCTGDVQSTYTRINVPDMQKSKAIADYLR